MKKISEWLKAHWILVGIIAWVAIMVIVLITHLSLSDKIQAMSVITLVIITLFYAVQTQKLVKEQRDALEEERNKRYAEFGMERIKIFLRPLLKMFEGLNDSLSVITQRRDRPLIYPFDSLLAPFQVRLDNIDELFFEYLFMASAKLRSDLLRFLREVKKSMPTNENQTESYNIRWKEETESKIRDLKGTIVVETSLISQQIKKTYGVLSHETEILESIDDLTVLLERPPARI